MLQRLALFAASALLFFLLAISPSSAQGDDGGEALEENVVTTTSCIEGVLSDDGQHCIVPRLDAPTSPAAGDTVAPVPAFTG